MLKITSINNGVVLDHIPVGCGLKIFDMLNLNQYNSAKALIMNVNSNKMKKKDIVKIEDYTDFNFDILSLISSDITINIIEDERIVKKIQPKVPLVIEDLIVCKNPRCITSIEKDLTHKFVFLADKEYSCAYCEEAIKLEFNK